MDARAARMAMGRRCVVAAALLWSMGGVITKLLEHDGLTIALYRGLFAGLVLAPTVPRAKWRFRPPLVPFALIFGAMTAAYIGSVKTTTAANAIYLQYTSVFWTVPLSAWFLGERADRRALIGIGLALVGIVVIVALGYDGRPNEVQGILLGLASGVGYAAVTVFMRSLRDLDPAWLSVVGNLGGALVLGAWIAASRPVFPIPSGPQLLLLAAFGTVQMALSYTLFARGLREIGAPEAGLIALLEPLVGPLWVFLIAHERPTNASIVGGSFLLAGVLCRYWPARRFKS
jgi:drug/metabolite transporter (DMT)-like permease